MARKINKRDVKRAQEFVEEMRAAGYPDDVIRHMPPLPLYPRFWPQVPVLIVVSFALSYFIRQWLGDGWLPVGVSVVAGMVFGFAYVKVRWAIWRKRNPMLETDEIKAYMEQSMQAEIKARRAKAHLN